MICDKLILAYFFAQENQHLDCLLATILVTDSPDGTLPPRKIHQLATKRFATEYPDNVECYILLCYLKLFRLWDWVFTESADSVIESRCPSVCMYVCMSVCLSPVKKTSPSIGEVFFTPPVSPPLGPQTPPRSPPLYI